MSKIAEYLKMLNMILLPFTISICLAQHVFYTFMTFIYVDEREVGSYKLPKNTRKNWFVRLLLLGGVFTSLAIGYGAFHILDMTDLAHVKKLEYLIIVVPIQINFGILLGSGVQYKVEQRNARKQQIARACQTEAAISVDEKQALLQA